MATFKNGFFTSDHSNIEILDKEVHVVSDIANGAFSKAGSASDKADAASNAAQIVSDKVDALSAKLDALGTVEGASGTIEGASDGASVAGDAAALVGDAAETIGDSDKIMLYCTIASAVAVTFMVCFIVFCFYQGIKHEKEAERNSSPADQDTQKENQKWNEPFGSDSPNSAFHTGSTIEHTFNQPQQNQITAK